LTVPTPVGPVPRDPNDPELWEEWEGDPWADEAGRSPRSRWSGPTRLIAAVLLVGFAIFMIIR
jgi:hypothetical protein